MPGLDAGVALRAILRRFVVGCWLCGPSLGGVLGVGGLFEEAASLGAGVWCDLRHGVGDDASDFVRKSSLDEIESAGAREPVSPGVGEDHSAVAGGRWVSAEGDGGLSVGPCEPVP